MTTRTESRSLRLGRQIALVLIALVFLLPAYILVNMSLKYPSQSTNPIAPVTQPTLANFGNAWIQANLSSAFTNSLLITVTSTVVVVIFASLASYPLARVHRRWSKVAFTTFIAGLLIPFQLIMIPLYTTLRDLNILGSPFGVILLNIGSQLPFAIFMYSTFLRASEKDYEEAAELDGCGHLQIYWHIVLPLTRPVTGTVAILCVITFWNEFFAPLLFLNPQSATVPLALYAFVGTYVSQWNLVFAGLILSALPILILYLFMQKTVIQGFAGGLKG